MNIRLQYISVAVTILLRTVSSSKILGVFFMPSKSHFTLGNSLARGLAEAGHDVTLINLFGDDQPLPKNGSYRDIVLTGLLDDFLSSRKISPTEMNTSSFMQPFIFNTKMLGLIEKAIKHPEFLNLVNSNETFDVVIVEQFANDVCKYLAPYFDAELIVFSPIGTYPTINNMVGNPTMVSFTPGAFSKYRGRMKFFDRVHNTLIYILEEVLHEFVFLQNQERLLHKYFSNSTNIRNLFYNVSLVLLNSHESIWQPVPQVPNMIQIGGYHVQPPKKLPKDIQVFLDNAEDGVIFFSMGSYLKSTEFPVSKRNALLAAFAQLKEKVLWKWEDEVLPGQPSNVKTAKWLPQNDILAHPNVKLFITHGGLLSSIETIYHGVPVLAFPVFGDQSTNAHNGFKNGYALVLPFKDPDFSEKKIYSLLRELLDNPKYRENAKRRSMIFHDRPMKPMDAAVYWVEYVIRHKGARHLRVDGLDMPWYQYFLVDVIAFLFMSLSLVLSVFLIFVRLVVKSLTGKSKKVKRS
ncbi:unnamed protein product [Phaedon cochleariae]|uniref:UDP-glucuronosyltransferase n=1 Tax=Phaedon cochleariae TaxID=80249 RepID=A0A9P0GP41_PHACE|nr:unnamed protein product [Phaedon cochleariae]